jgi:hypothetical protein
VVLGVAHETYTNVPRTGIQAGGLVAQTVLARPDAPIGISLIFMSQSLAGTIFLAVDQTVFAGKLRSGLGRMPGVDVAAISSAGVGDIRNLVSEEQLPLLLEAYNDAVTSTFYVAAGCACVAFVAALFVEWKSVKAEKGGPGFGGGGGGGPPVGGGPTGGGPPGSSLPTGPGTPGGDKSVGPEKV